MRVEIKNNIISKLDNLERYTEIISTAAGFLGEDFSCNPLIYGGAVRYILLGLYNVRESSRLMSEQLNLKHSEYDSDVLKILAEKKVFPQWLAESLSIDLNDFAEKQFDDFGGEKKLYCRLDRIVSDFRHFKKYVLEYLI